MKKILVLLTLLIMSAFQICYASNDEIKTIRDSKEYMNGITELFLGDTEIKPYNPSYGMWYGIEKLRDFGVIPPEAEFRILPENGITKREILTVLYDIKLCHHSKSLISETKEEVAELLAMIELPNHRLEAFGWQEEVSFEDANYESDDFVLAYNLYAAGLLRGTEIDGKRYALLDGETTYGEAITMVCRLFFKAPYFYEEEAVRLMQGMGYKDNYIYHFAEKINLINSDSLMDVSTPEITVEQLSELIPQDEFYWLVYRALYIPVCSTWDLGKPFFYINEYVSNPGR